MPGGLGVDRVSTARLVGRRPEPGDDIAWVRFFTDPRTPEAAWPADLRTAPDARRILAATIAHWERWGFGAWSVLRGGEVIGRVGLNHTDATGRPEIELAWFVHPDHWGQGYATEMAREAVRVAFEVLELDEVIAYTTPANAASRAVMEHLGMVDEGEIAAAGLPHVLSRLRR